MRRQGKMAHLVGGIELFLLMSVIFFGCMPKTRAVSEENSVKREVVNVLLAMQTAYEKQNLDEFMIWVHKKYPKRSAFRKEILKDFQTSQDVHLSIVIDQILVGEKGADLKVHWYRTWISLPGKRLVKKEGRARLLFSLNPIRLWIQTGEKPFGIPSQDG